MWCGEKWKIQQSETGCGGMFDLPVTKMLQDVIYFQLMEGKRLGFGYHLLQD